MIRFLKPAGCKKKRAKVDKVKNGTIESNMFANGVLGLR